MNLLDTYSATDCIMTLELAPRPTRRKARAGLVFQGAAMPSEPSTKRAAAFVDGQNLYHSVREAFGYTYPDYDVSALSRNICRSKGWELLQVRFYTGIPDSSDDAFWSAFWVNKLRVLSWQQVHVYSRPLRYRNKRVTLPDGTAHTFL